MEMKSTRKIAVITGGRQDYGLLYWVLRELKESADCTLQLVATGMHLSPEFGLTVRHILSDGFALSGQVEMLLSSDSAVGTAKSMGVATIGFADLFQRLQPDLLVIAGDRFELLAAAQTALIMKIPIAHIFGGDITEGAYDDAIRHSLTKMSHLHFVSNELSGQRVRQMGEDPANVFVYGSPSLDYIRRMRLVSRDELEKDLDFHLKRTNLLITFHPVTLGSPSSAEQCDELLAALEDFKSDMGLIFTLPNADNDGKLLAEKVRAFVARHPDTAVLFDALGQHRFLNTLAQVNAVVGNSSSGIYEAPSFKKPTVNIGERQRGRLRAASVIDCPPRREAIRSAIESALTMNCETVTNPYGDGASAEKIVSVLRTVNLHNLVIKRFHLLER